MRIHRHEIYNRQLIALSLFRRRIDPVCARENPGESALIIFWANKSFRSPAMPAPVITSASTAMIKLLFGGGADFFYKTENDANGSANQQ